MLEGNGVGFAGEVKAGRGGNQPYQGRGGREEKRGDHFGIFGTFEGQKSAFVHSMGKA